MEQLYVPDATVIIKWAVPPTEAKEQDRSLDLLQLWLEGGCRFLLPPHWLTEVGSLLLQHYPQRAADLLELLSGFDFPEAANSSTLHRAALQLADSQGVSYYGACYQAVAQVHGGILITANSAYWRKAKASGTVLQLKDFKTS